MGRREVSGGGKMRSGGEAEGARDCRHALYDLLVLALELSEAEVADVVSVPVFFLREL